MDEATASVDVATDHQIQVSFNMKILMLFLLLLLLLLLRILSVFIFQEVLRDEFKLATVLTIAHR